jgi:hypothetical protein
MIQKILEVNYKGFHLALAEEGQNGWKCVIGEQEILFPHAQAAEAAIDEILKDAAAAIAKNNGMVIGKVLKSQVTKTVEVEKPY